MIRKMKKNQFINFISYNPLDQTDRPEIEIDPA